MNNFQQYSLLEPLLHFAINPSLRPIQRSSLIKRCPVYKFYFDPSHLVASVDLMGMYDPSFN